MEIRKGAISSYWVSRSGTGSGSFGSLSARASVSGDFAGSGGTPSAGIGLGGWRSGAAPRQGAKASEAAERTGGEGWKAFFWTGLTELTGFRRGVEWGGTHAERGQSGTGGESRASGAGGGAGWIVDVDSAFGLGRPSGTGIVRCGNHGLCPKLSCFAPPGRMGTGRGKTRALRR